MSNVLTETICSLSKIAAQSPSARGAKAHRCTVFRWVTRGIRVKGTLVRLEAVRVAGQWITSQEAYERFIEKCSELSNAPIDVMTPAQIRRENERVTRELDHLLRTAK